MTHWALKPRKQPAFYEEHRISFAKYDAAKAYFDAHSMAKKLPSVKKLQSEIDSLVSDRNDVITAYREKQQHAKELDTLYSSIHKATQRTPALRKEQDER